MPPAGICGRRHFHFPFSIFRFHIPNVRFKHVPAKKQKNPLILKGYAYQYRIMGRTPIKKEIENHENQDYNSNSGNRNHIDGAVG